MRRVVIPTEVSMPSSLPRRLLLLALLAAACPSAERPLGTVEQAEGATLVIAFDAGARIDPGSLLAIYAPAAVERHPLTNEVIVEQRRLVAKVQVLGSDRGRVSARVAWQEAAVALVAGMDAVPMPGEAAPNSPPALAAGAPAVMKVAAQSAVEINLPVVDPDGDALTCSWSFDGVAGRNGRLAALTTSRPSVLWYTPAAVAEVTLRMVARDRLGQEFTHVQKVQVGADESDLRKREAKVFQRCGTARRLDRLHRDEQGVWWGIDAGTGAMVRSTPGWLQDGVFAPGADVAPGAPVVVVPWRGQLYVLDGDQRMVLVFTADGMRKRRLGGFERPTDLVIDDSGTLFIADQSAGGIAVHEADGRFRSRLGRPGKGADAFTGLTRLALGVGGELHALDPAQRQVQRFDRLQRRLDTWEVPGDARNPPVDLAVHPRGLLVLLADGRMLLYDAKGAAGQALPGAADARLVSDLGAAGSLQVGGDGSVLVCYPDSGFIARHAANGALTGLRGAGVWTSDTYVADGSGRMYGLDRDLGRVSQYDAEGWLTAAFGGIGKKALFSAPVAIAVQPDGQAVCVLDSERKCVSRFASAALGDKPLVFGQPGANNGQFNEPIALAMDDAGRTYVLDGGAHRVVAFDAEGRFLFNAGRFERGKQPDELADPRLLAVSPAGDALYVYDYDRFEVKKFALDQQGQKAAHVTNAGGKGDGPGQIRRLSGLECDRRGLLYLLDNYRLDLQVFDFRGNNSVPIMVRKLADFGVQRTEVLTVAADGQVWIGGGEGLAGIHW